MGVEHAQSGFYNQSNGGLCNDIMPQRSKDTSRMTQYYSQNFSENTSDCDSDIQESKISPFSNQIHINSYPGPVDNTIKFERQNSPECTYLNSAVASNSQSVDCQLSNKWGGPSMGKRNNPFSNELEEISKCPRYVANNYHSNQEEESESNGLVTKATNDTNVNTQNIQTP